MNVSANIASGYASHPESLLASFTLTSLEESMLRMPRVVPRCRARSMFLGPFCLAVLCAASGGPAAAEETIDEIVVTSLRLTSSLQETARSVAVVEQDQIQAGGRLLSLDESLSGVAGLYLQSAQNHSQDLRISIRGFGARSSFGVRGVRIIVDGIPESLPDGQAQVDGIDLGTTQRIEVLRGPASSLYGNAAGGVISLTSELGEAEPHVQAAITAGSYDFQRYQLKAAQSGESIDYVLSASHLATDGYRNHSKFESTALTARMAIRLSPQDELRLSLNAVDQPVAQDAGGISAEQASTDRRSARLQNELFAAGEVLDQQRIAALFTSNRLGGELTVRNYFANRDFANKLPFISGGAVDLDRSYYGLGVQYANEQSSSSGVQYVAGFDIDLQDDARRRFDNMSGVRGDLVFDQDEKVDSSGVFVLANIQRNESWDFSAGLRFDEVGFSVDDRFVADGDDSGSVSYQKWSPSLSASYSNDAGVWFVAYGTSFETPTTTELANPDGTGGFNRDLRPQTSDTVEIGFKSSGERHSLALAAFHIDLQDELVPFELASSPGRVFYANAGSSTRLGLEAETTWRLNQQLEAALSLTWSDFSFDRFELDGERFDGNRQPGLPEYFGFLSLRYQPRDSTRLNFETRYSGKLFATNDNTVEVKSYLVSSLRLSHEWLADRWSMQAFVGINNLFNERYNSNIRINAFGGRYFEPAEERNWYAGITARFGK